MFNPIPATTIAAIQDQIIAEFQQLEGNREEMLTYIMELGERLPPLEEGHRNDHVLVKGCMSKVWITHTNKGGRLFFWGDSNTSITQGLLALLFRVLSGQTMGNIIHADLYFVEQIGMPQLIGTQRSGGFGQMVRTIKLIAIAEDAKQKVVQ